MPLTDIRLSDGTTIPPIAFGGGGRIRDTSVFEAAIRSGYRLIDTAEMYANDHLIFAGNDAPLEATRNGPVLISTKIMPGATLPHTVEEALRRMARARVDLLLLHFPVDVRTGGDHLSRLERTWREMEELVNEGKVQSLGVSNTGEALLDFLMARADKPPTLNQIEHHPHMQQWPLIDYCHSVGLGVQAYCPLGAPYRRSNQGEGLGPIENPTILEIAAKHSRSASQVILRWHIQKDVVPVVSSLSVERMRENLAIDDFSLSREDVERIDDLDRGERIAGGLLPTTVGLHGTIRKERVHLSRSAAKQWRIPIKQRWLFNLRSRRAGLGLRSAPRTEAHHTARLATEEKASHH